MSVARGRLVTTPVGTASAGILVLGAAAVWWSVSALLAGSPVGVATGLLLGVALTVAASWIAAARWPSVVLAGVVGAAVAVFGAEAGATLRSGPLQGPFGYANATAAFFAQAIVAALLLAVVARGPLRVVAVIAATGFVPIVLLTQSSAAVILLPATVGVALAIERWRGGRAAVAACGGLFVAALVTTIVLGAIGPRDAGGPLDRVIGATVTEERVGLWNDALSLTARHPLLGVGPGGFALAGRIASSDPDLRWAHNEFLQAGSETGLLGYAFAVGVFLWGFVALGQGSPGRVAALSAAGLAILGIHASLDYVLHFPFVTIIGAAVLGAGLGAARREPARTRPTSSTGPIRGTT